MTPLEKCYKDGLKRISESVSMLYFNDLDALDTAILSSALARSSLTNLTKCVLIENFWEQRIAANTLAIIIIDEYKARKSRNGD